MDYSKINYKIFSGRNYLQHGELEIRNKSFEVWNSVWKKVYEEKEEGFKLSSDEYSRQDLICALTYESQIAALHLYSFFNLASAPDMKSHYFNFFSDYYINELKSQNVKSVMSMEFLTVAPEFRKTNFGFPTGSLICELGTRVFGLTKADAIVAPARVDVKVNQIAYDIGFTCIEKAVMQRGFECDMIACYQGKQKRSDIPNLSIIADDIWSRKEIMPSARHFFSQSSVLYSVNLKAAA